MCLVHACHIMPCNILQTLHACACALQHAGLPACKDMHVIESLISDSADESSVHVIQHLRRLTQQVHDPIQCRPISSRDRVHHEVGTDACIRARSLRDRSRYPPSNCNRSVIERCTYACMHGMQHQVTLRSVFLPARAKPLSTKR